MSTNLKVLDGGFSTLLIQEFNHPEISNDPLWGSKLILTNPQVIISAHKKYLESGADLIETCTYQATVEGFMKHCSMSTTEAIKVIQKGVKLCLQARDEYWLKNKNRPCMPKVIGSIGPYGAFLADRSEYSGNYVDLMSIEQLKNWHRCQVEPIEQCGVDVVAFETFTTIREPLAVVHLMKEYPHCNYYISFNCKDGNTTWHNDNIEDVVKEILSIQPRNSNLIGLGINCTKPKYIEQLLKKMKCIMDETKREDIILIAYPDGGGEWLNDISWKPDKTSVDWDTDVPKWVAVGAQWIGGCCMTTHHDIAQIRRIVDSKFQLSGT